MNWDSFHGIDQYKFLNNLTKFLEDWIKFSHKDRDEYFERFLKEGEKKECKLTFLSRVLKYNEDTLLSILYNYDSNEEKFQQKIKEIRKLYFTINPTKKITALDEEIVNDLINNTPCYIISGAFLTNKLDFIFSTFRQQDYFKKLNPQIKKKQEKCIEDLKNDFLELLKQAPEKAFKSKEDLFFYLLLKDFYYFKSLNKRNFRNDFIEQCNSIYINKIKITNISQRFFSHSLFDSLKEKFKNFHDHNDYKSKLKILEEKKKNYPCRFNDKDHNEPFVNNKLNDFCTDVNVSWINSSNNKNSNNSYNVNKRKLAKEDSNKTEQNNYKKRLSKDHHAFDLNNNSTTTSTSINIILEIKETENQNHSKQYDQNLSNTEHSFSQSSISSQLLELRELAVRYISEHGLEKTYYGSQESAFSIVSKRTFNQNPQVPYNLEYRNSHQENFNSNNLPTNQNFYNKLN